MTVTHVQSSDWKIPSPIFSDISKNIRLGLIVYVYNFVYRLFFKQSQNLILWNSELNRMHGNFLGESRNWPLLTMKWMRYSTWGTPSGNTNFRLFKINILTEFCTDLPTFRWFHLWWTSSFCWYNINWLFLRLSTPISSSYAQMHWSVNSWSRVFAKLCY